jgi:deoxyribodipyrimidine photo-lyase
MRHPDDSTPEARVIHWFRGDLRLADNRALAAAGRAGAVVPVFILDEATGARPLGAASRWWLGESLAALDGALRRRGSGLVLRRGDSVAALAEIAAATGATGVTFTQLCEPWSAEFEASVNAALTARGLACQRYAGQLLFDPAGIRTQAGEPFKVFTPYWKACLAAGEPRLPLAEGSQFVPAAGLPASEQLADWELAPSRPDWAAGFRQHWQPGEVGAQAALARFLDGPVGAYADDRNRPDRVGTSRLSPHLHFGEVSPHQCWHAARHAEAAEPRFGRGVAAFLRELVWREFSYNLLRHWPHLPTAPFRPEFGRFPWVDDPSGLAAWQRGRTGYPIVDAGMRELWSTGWMHNRVRMIVASFLIKDLMIHWQAGERWFWDTLVDADPANNAASWQWVAGCGADAAPYFRVFNPVTQGQKFDPDGAYVRRWLPELARLPDAFVHAPSEAPALVLREAGVELGKDYPLPIVDHAEARRRALAAFEVVKAGG